MSSSINVVLGGWKMAYRFRFLVVVGLLLVVFFTANVYLTRDCIKINNNNNNNQSRQEYESSVNDDRRRRRCDLFSGTWVYDNQSYPLYREQSCSFMVDDYACQKFGRQDFKYQQWRWQPRDCELPRFNATALLEKLRGKRLVFVGDSINKNQWVSMVCLVESSILPPLKSLHRDGSSFIFKAIEYNASLEFFWAPLLVESNCDDPISHSIKDRIVRINAIERHAKHWTNADFLIFNSYQWWMKANMTLLWGSSFESPDGIRKKVGMRLRRYESALRTWSDWLDFNVNRTKTKLFFMSLSPSHKRSEDLGGSSQSYYCYNETEPVSESEEGYWGSESDREMMRVAEAAIQELLERRGLKVHYLNITQLSEYRKEAHPSIFRKHKVSHYNNNNAEPSKIIISSTRSFVDCVHVCLPGLPDLWNQILYAYIYI